jgi:uncharacterized protein YndB with AHSA1/START domain
MAHKTQVLKCKCLIEAPPASVYQAFGSATALREWFCDSAQVELRKGGRLYAWWSTGYYAAGQFISVNPDKKLIFTWRGRGEPESTQVQITFASRNAGTAVAVAHSGIWSGKKWAAAVGEFEDGWHHALDNLKSVLETGQDPRFVRRPMLGINVSEFNADVARQKGVPVSEGALVDSVIDGMGAQAAGLRGGDVLVSLGGNPVTGYTGLGGVLQKYQAGDRVPIVFYRDGEKLTATMELSRRPLPEVPPSAERLAEQVRLIYAELDAELEAVFQDASEAQASRRPSPHEWSAKEHLAHLLANERNTHQWIAGLISGQESDATPDNVTAIYEAMASVYSAPEMVAALKRAEAETVAMLAALPAEFLARKGSYWRLGHALLQDPTHSHDHFAQMRQAIQAAQPA